MLKKNFNLIMYEKILLCVIFLTLNRNLNTLVRSKCIHAL